MHTPMFTVLRVEADAVSICYISRTPIIAGKAVAEAKDEAGEAA